MAATEMAIILNNAGEPKKGKAIGHTAGTPPQDLDVGPGEKTPGKKGIEGKIEEVVTITLVRTSGNSPGCCWWIKLGGQYYCMPVQCP